MFHIAFDYAYAFSALLYPVTILSDLTHSSHDPKGVVSQMCYRFYADLFDKDLQKYGEQASASSLCVHFEETLSRPLKTHGEIFPTDVVPVIAPGRKAAKAVFPMKWGFILPKNKAPLANARMETAAERPTFKEAWLSHRCIIPASHYYEWEHFTDPKGKKKTGDKYCIHPIDSSRTFLCGLYRLEDGLPVFTILTRQPDPELLKVHDRMPMILPEEKIDEWIAPGNDPEKLIPYTLTKMSLEKVEE